MAFDDDSTEDLGMFHRMLKITGTEEDAARLEEIRVEMATRGHWYCDHCEHITPLPKCNWCGRSEVDQRSIVEE